VPSWNFGSTSCTNSRAAKGFIGTRVNGMRLRSHELALRKKKDLSWSKRMSMYILFLQLPQERTKWIGEQAREKGGVSGEKAVKNGLFQLWAGRRSW
jgi:hypothetical protein